MTLSGRNHNSRPLNVESVESVESSQWQLMKCPDRKVKVGVMVGGKEERISG